MDFIWVRNVSTERPISSASSGRLVPTATMVSPITSSETPRLVATLIDAHTRALEEAISASKPSVNTSQALPMG